MFNLSLQEAPLMKKTIINYANGDKYEGGLKGKRKHGYGIFTWADGSIFFGFFGLIFYSFKIKKMNKR